MLTLNLVCKGKSYEYMGNPNAFKVIDDDED